MTKEANAWSGRLASASFTLLVVGLLSAFAYPRLGSLLVVVGVNGFQIGLFSLIRTNQDTPLANPPMYVPSKLHDETVITHLAVRKIMLEDGSGRRIEAAEYLERIERVG